MPPTKDLISLFDVGDGEIEAIFMRINDLPGFIKCEGYGKEKYIGTIESIEKKLKELHPKALIVRGPLEFCSLANDSKPYACLAHIFERTYADKIGFEYETPFSSIL